MTQDAYAATRAGCVFGTAADALAPARGGRPAPIAVYVRFVRSGRPELVLAGCLSANEHGSRPPRPTASAVCPRRAGAEVLYLTRLFLSWCSGHL